MEMPVESELVEPGSKIRVEFALEDENGSGVQADKDSFDVIVGFGQLLARIETALLGMRLGETVTLTLAAEEAFGKRDPCKIIEFDRDEFPPDVVAGDHFEAEQQDGTILVLRILEVLQDGVVVDLNHPLAGQKVHLALTVRQVRPATKSELDAMLASEKRTATFELDALLPPQSLLRGRTER